MELNQEQITAVKTEQWKIIEDFPNYEISSFGRVIKIKKLGKHDTSPLYKPMTGYDRKGYHAFQLRTPDRKRKYVSGHVLVLEAFVGARPPGYIAHHDDTDTKNNKLPNLSWETPSNNIKLAYLAGNLNQKGSRNNSAKLNEMDILNIRGVLGMNIITHKKIGELFGVARSTISQINGGYNWSHVEAIK